MTSLRVTERGIGMRSLANLQTNLSRLGQLQEQLSSGKLINRPSDSPTGTVSAMQLRGQIRANQQYQRNAQDGLSWLGTTETALTSAVSSVQRVRDLVVQGMSSGSAGSPTARQALATEVSSIQQELVGLGNTTYLNRPVFGGTTAGSAAYDSSGNYIGDDGQVTRTIGDNSQVRVDVTGQEAFGTGSTQLFQVVNDIANHLQNDPSQLGADLDRLDAAAATMQNQLSSIGARYNRITTAQQNSSDLVTTLTGNLSDVEDVDLPKTITDLQMQQVAYQAALGATAKVIQPSLVDFLQ